MLNIYDRLKQLAAEEPGGVQAAVNWCEIMFSLRSFMRLGDFRSPGRALEAAIMETSLTTPAPRLWRMTWITTSPFWNTPVPAGAAVDAYGGFVRAHDTGATQSCQDRADLSIRREGHPPLLGGRRGHAEVSSFPPARGPALGS
jgi:hypothetical protein